MWLITFGEMKKDSKENASLDWRPRAQCAIWVLGQLVECCAQIAASTADVEDASARSKLRLQPLHAEAVQEWLRDDHIVIDWLRFVLVGSLLLDRLVHELASVYLSHDCADSLRLTVPLLSEGVDEAIERAFLRLLVKLLLLSLLGNH